MSDCLVLQRSGDMAWLTLNRPELKNAISYEMWLEIPDLVDQVERDSALKVLILRGAYGGVFSAGADITEFRELRSTADGARRYNKATEQARTSLAELTKPSIAMVNGLCMGGGCELALACDLRFADTEARFSLTPAKLGLVYGLGATKDLVDLVGPSQAKYILYSGREPHWVRWRLGSLDSNRVAGLRLAMIRGFVLERRDVVEGASTQHGATPRRPPEKAARC